MTNIKSPVDPFGHNISHFTKARAADNVKKAKASSDLLRGLLFSLAVPLIAGAAYLMFSNDEIYIPSLSVSNDLPVLVEMPPSQPARAPAARAELLVAPPVQPELAVAALGIATLGAEDIQAAPGAKLEKPRPVVLQLNSIGKLESPFSLELDANGLEISRKEFADRAFFLPTIPRGAFESAKTLSLAQVPDDFKNIIQARPFAFNDSERIRVTELRRRAPELNRWFNSMADLSNSRLRTNQQAIESFTAASNESRKADALAELQWMKAASIMRDMDGDRSVEKRLLDVMMLWVRTYKPTGSAVSDLPLIDAVYAYNNIRHLWSSTDQNVIDGFFNGLVDAQFIRMRSHKVFDEEHAAHVQFALTVGLVTENRALQLHGLTQYKLHVDQSALLNLDSFGTDEVKTLHHLLRAAYALDRTGNGTYRSLNLNRAIATLAGTSQSSPSDLRLNTVALGAYFRPDLYPRLAALTVQSGVLNSRFGTSDGAVLAALRRPTSSMDPAVSGRQPSGVPTKLPPKTPRR